MSNCSSGLISTRAELKEYALRANGHPVVEINIAEEQLEDRLNDALQFFSEYHFDGVEKVYLKYKLSQTDIDNGYISFTATNRLSLNSGASGFEDDQAIQNSQDPDCPENVLLQNLIVSVTRIFPFTQQSVGMFDVRYQYALNDLYTFGTIDLIQYDMTQQYLSLLRQFLSPDKSIRFNRVANKLYLDSDKRQLNEGMFLIIEAYRILDPRVYPEIYNDRLLKKYTVALVRWQWGVNLSKYSGIKLPGDITLDGQSMMKDSWQQKEEIEKEIILKGELPVDFIMG
jgi:hypothetical protein